MKPGRSVSPAPSMVRAPVGAFSLGPTALICPFCTQTSPLAITRVPSNIRTLRMTKSFFGAEVCAGAGNPESSAIKRAARAMLVARLVMPIADDWISRPLGRSTVALFKRRLLSVSLLRKLSPVSPWCPISHRRLATGREWLALSVPSAAKLVLLGCPHCVARQAVCDETARSPALNTFFDFGEAVGVVFHGRKARQRQNFRGFSLSYETPLRDISRRNGPASKTNLDQASSAEAS